MAESLGLAIAETTMPTAQAAQHTMMLINSVMQVETNPRVRV